MASSSGDREQDPTLSARPQPPSPSLPPSPPKSGNPFIKFRDFADAQIGSLLQGIIGLPSALSRGPAENTRWAIFDEDLRRRDELPARQRELRESEARRLNQQRAEEVEEDEIRVQKSPDWKPWKRSDQKDVAPPSSDTSTPNKDITMDLPLYSPVSKALFAHLHTPFDGEVDWKQMDSPSAAWNGFLWGHYPYQIRGDQISPNVMGMTQCMVYNHLNNYPDLRSEYSLLPYLMFSPYSPLRLATLSQSSHLPHCRRNVPQDQFPYCEAFEDLVRITQARQPLPRFFGYPLNPDRRKKPSLLAGDNIAWIDHLHRSKILQEKEIRDLHLPDDDFLLAPLSGRPWLPFLHQSSENGKETETEQDMYDRFLRWASKGQIDADKNKDKKGTHDQKSSDGSIPELPHSLQELMDTFSSKGIHEWVDIVDRLAKPPTEGLEQEKSTTIQPSKEGLEQESPESYLPIKKPQDSGRVVSTTTTTEQTRHEDGSVETRVEVWKRFADGRETTTTTTHFDEPAWDNNDNKDREPAPEQAKDESTEKSEKRSNEKHEKKGWFWN